WERTAISRAGRRSGSRSVVRSLTCVVFARPLRVRVTTVKQTSRAAVAGRDGRAGSPAAARRRDRIRALSRSSTSSEPSFRVLRVLNGEVFAPFLTRHSRSAPAPDSRSQRSMEKNPRSARFSCPGPNAPASRRGGSAGGRGGPPPGGAPPPPRRGGGASPPGGGARGGAPPPGGGGGP